MKFILLLLSIPALSAHDMWIEPTSFRPQSGQIVSLRLRVGEHLLGDPLPRVPELIHTFVVDASGARQPIPGRNGSDPAGYLRASSPGLQIVGYFSNPSAAEQPAEKFNKYLHEEGLEAIARPVSTGLVREQFSRCAKSLLLAGPASPAQADRRLGFPLELTAERNPYTLRPGEELPVQLIWQNRPLAGALIVAFHRQNPFEKITARSDQNGRVRLRLPNPGMWLIKAVHMVAAPPDANAQWSSYWASLTFDNRGVQP